MNKKFVITAYRHVGKTTLVKKVLSKIAEQNTRALAAGLKRKNVCGFFTEKIDFEKDARGGDPNNLKTPIEPGRFPVFIYPVDNSNPLSSKPIIDDAHIVGLCGCGQHYTNYEVFDTLGVEYLNAPDPQTLIVLDEVGFMEMGAEKYKEKIFEILRSDNPVLLMLKDRMDVDLIKQIRDFPGITFIEMNEENRDVVTQQVIGELLRQKALK